MVIYVLYIYILFLNIHLTCNCLSFVHVDKIHCTYTTGNMVTFRFVFLHRSQHSNRHELTKPSISGVSLSDFEVSIANDHRARL